MMRLLARALVLIVVIIAISALAKWLQDGERIAQASALGWHQLPRNATHTVPNPMTYRDTAIVQVLSAPTFGWRGYVAIHPWLIYKRAGQTDYTRFEVIGWGRTHVVRRNHAGADSLWYGATPEVLVAHQGPEAQVMIDDIERAIANYPYAQSYKSYPGPNSNTFMAHIGREVPELNLDLPPTAIGKDYQPWEHPFTTPPSGRGVQLSLGGFFGLILSTQEGIELNLFGVAMGLDFNCPALRLPFIGRVGINGTWTDRYCLPEVLNRNTTGG
jgi:hypothetical protein